MDIMKGLAYNRYWQEYGEKGNKWIFLVDIQIITPIIS